MSKTIPYNIVLVTLDCVRPDHLGCYGYPGVETPHLDALARQGVVFEQAVTHAPNTWVSHAVLFTGCLPTRNGLRAATHRISSRVTTMAELLSAHHYATAAFSGTSLVGRSQGFHRGFRCFQEPEAGDSLRVEKALWRLDWPAAWQAATAFIKRCGRPFLLWLHYIDTHHLPRVKLPEYYLRAFAPNWQHYDGKISFADQVCIGEISRFLANAGLLDQTVLVVFADHGEELRPDDRPVHDGRPSEGVIRIPLIIRFPEGVAPPGMRVFHQVRIVDIFPTLCDLLHIPPPPQIQGNSLLPLIAARGPADPESRVAYLENQPKGYLGIRTGEWKLIMRHASPDDWDGADPMVEGLYHHPTDPEERLDLSANHPATLEHLRGLCLELARADASPSWIDPEDQKRVEKALKALGYL